MLKEPHKVVDVCSSAPRIENDAAADDAAAASASFLLHTSSLLLSKAALRARMTGEKIFIDHKNMLCVEHGPKPIHNRYYGSYLWTHQSLL
jgi:hypothetical protein